MARDVTLGLATDERVEILSGLTEADTVVASATFLVDAESNLGTLLGGMGNMPGMDISTPPTRTPSATAAGEAGGEAAPEGHDADARGATPGAPDATGSLTGDAQADHRLVGGQPIPRHPGRARGDCRGHLGDRGAPRSRRCPT